MPLELRRGSSDGKRNGEQNQNLNWKLGYFDDEGGRVIRRYLQEDWLELTHLWLLGWCTDFAPSERHVVFLVSQGGEDIFALFARCEEGFIFGVVAALGGELSLTGS